ncbi:MAG: hypothetical protein ACRDBO_00075 [Lachnospiraceae bacterium]
MKQIICYSGGHSSALVAIEAVRKYGKNNVILLNHDISSIVEHKDIKRFKQEIADYLDVPITPANMKGFETMTPLKVAMKAKAFQVDAGRALCTSKLKTEPFYKWLDETYPVAKGDVCDNAKVLYGFDKNEPGRIQRRVGVMAAKGYKTDYPLAYWDRTVDKTEDIGIKRPVTYNIFKHANCFGCLKAGMQHWYVVYCLRPDIFTEAIKAEAEIGYSIINDVYLEELIPKYQEMQTKGICPNDKINSQSFWAKVNNTLPEQMSFLPCECMID